MSTTDVRIRQVVKAKFLLEAVESLSEVPWWRFIERSRRLEGVWLRSSSA